MNNLKILLGEFCILVSTIFILICLLCVRELVPNTLENLLSPHDCGSILKQIHTDHLRALSKTEARQVDILNSVKSQNFTLEFVDKGVTAVIIHNPPVEKVSNFTKVQVKNSGHKNFSTKPVCKRCLICKEYLGRSGILS